MVIKWKNISHSLIAKIIVFTIVIVSFSSAITYFLNLDVAIHEDFEILFEDNYYQSRRFMDDSEQFINILNSLLEFKSEDNIIAGKTIDSEKLSREKEMLFAEFEKESKSFNPNLTYEENYKIFEEVYKEKIALLKDELIEEDLETYKYNLNRLKEYTGLLYFASHEENVFSNINMKTKDYFQSFPAYFLFDSTGQMIFPEAIYKNPYFYWISEDISKLREKDTVYLAFSEAYLKPRIEKWQEDKDAITSSLYQIAGLGVVFFIGFIYLLIVTGRKFWEDQKVHLNFVDKIYTDFNLGMCVLLIISWYVIMAEVVFRNEFYKMIFPVTLLIGTLGLILVLSLVRHFKNKTLIKDSLTYKILNKLFKFILEVYNSGSVGLKVVLLVIGYPLLILLVIAVFYMFPLAFVIIGVGVWLALKKVKEFNTIKEGLAKVKAGDIHHTINVSGNGELAKLAADINSITEGLNKAVENELKSERLKTELITNVSHDLRTPLTSIITYVDLLKTEKDPQKAEEYLKIIDQKAQRLKTLTEDLFEAAKASSGSLPVNFETIDLVSLITQGLGELDDKVQESQLQFKINNQHDKMYIKADGKLLWRAIENLLANIFKYALKGSRVYIDIKDLGTEIMLTIKNISAYELNISSDELMERFVRGDKSRSSEGSGLGLSIAKTLIELQKGAFNIEIDGDLFKVIIKMRK